MLWYIVLNTSYVKELYNRGIPLYNIFTSIVILYNKFYQSCCYSSYVQHCKLVWSIYSTCKISTRRCKFHSFCFKLHSPVLHDHVSAIIRVSFIIGRFEHPLSSCTSEAMPQIYSTFLNKKMNGPYRSCDGKHLKDYTS